MKLISIVSANAIAICSSNLMAFPANAEAGREEWRKRTAEKYAEYLEWRKRRPELCKSMPPKPPSGEKWVYAGQGDFGRSPCHDNWIKLVRNDKGRLTILRMMTGRQGRDFQDNQKQTYIFRCSPRDLWSNDHWSRIAAGSLFDTWLTKFC